MMNMSYCRFRNTEKALQECLDTLESLEDVDCDAEALSESEYQACRRLFKAFVDYLYNHEIVNDDGDLEKNLEDFLSSIPSEGV